jgi:hypothetical protein
MVPREKNSYQHDSVSTLVSTEVKDDGKVKRGEGHISLTRKLMLSAALWATEATCDYEHLYTIPVLFKQNISNCIGF